MMKQVINKSVSRREREIINLISQGLTSQEIGAELFISLNTVQSHRKNILAKLDVNNIAHLVRRSFEIGILNYQTQNINQ